MLTIHTSNSYKGLTSAILDKIKQSLVANPKGHNIVIVPDDSALYIEWLLMRELNLTSTFNIEVASFMRLAKKYVSQKKVLSEESALMLLAKVVAEQDELKCLSGTKQSEGMLRQLYTLIRSMRHALADTNAIYQSIDSLPIKLRYKVDDLSLIYKAYIKELKSNFSDSVSYLEKLKDQIPHNSHIANSNVFILLYSNFTSLEYKLIKELEQQAESVDIAVAAAIDKPNQELFSASGIIDRLTTLRDGQPYKIVVHDGQQNAVFSHMADNLFGYHLPQKMHSGGVIRLSVAENLHEEVVFVAREINKLIKNQEVKSFDDIAVIVSDPELYAPHIEAVFSTFNIPHPSQTVKHKLSNSALIKYLKAAFKIVREGKALKDLAEFAKNPYFDHDRECAERLERYCIEHGIERLTLSLADQEMDDFKNTILNCAEELMPHKTLGQGKGITADEFCGILENFLKHNNLQDKTLALAGQAGGENAQDGYMAHFYIKAYQTVISTCRQMRQVFGSLCLSYAKWCDIFFMTSDVEIATAQTKLNVYIAKPTDSIFSKQVLFVLGADNGVFPKADDEWFLFSERENEVLGQLGLVLGVRQTHEIRALLNICAPQKKLYISRYLSHMRPSPLFDMISNLFHDVEVLRQPDYYDVQDIDDFCELVSSKPNIPRAYYQINSTLGGHTAVAPKVFEYAKTALELLPQDARAKIDRATREEDTQYIDHVENLYFCPQKKTLKVTQIQKYYECPYAHFLKYGLKLRDPISLEFDQRDVGNITHEVLSKFLLKAYRLDEASAAKLAKEVIAEVLLYTRYSKKLDVPSNTNLKIRLTLRLERLCMDLYRITKNSDFKPQESEKDVELDIGQDVKLLGRIDRVDALKDFVSVIDYKTGSAPDDLVLEVYLGRNLQLFIYLAALVAQGKKPAALLYMELGDKLIKQEDSDSRYRAKGFVLKQKAIIEALDNNLRYGVGKSMVLPVGYKKTDEQVDFDRYSKVLEKQEFETLAKSSVLMAKAAYKDIAAGYIAKKPYKSQDKNACKYCDYKNICGEVDKFRGI